MAFFGAGMLVTFTEVAASLEDEFNEWYNREHIDERVNMPGFHRARRYIAADSATLVKYFATYETDTAEDLSAPAYMELLADQSDWSKKIMSQFSHFDRLTCRISIDQTHGVTGAAGLVRLFPPEAEMNRLREWLRETALPAMCQRQDVMGAALLENDLAVSNVGWLAAGNEIPADQKTEWLILIDATLPAAARGAAETVLGGDALTAFGMTASALDIGSYALLFGNQR
jgi:hypothetical protein